MYKVLLYHHRDGFDTAFPDEASRTLYNDQQPNNVRTILTGTGKDAITEAPTFDFTILPNHPLYDEIVKFKTWITVYRDDHIHFYGRVISDGVDFYGQRTVSCEGAINCLVDSLLDPVGVQNETPKDYLMRIIGLHNAQMRQTPYPEEYKTFTVGNVTIDEANARKRFKKEDSYSSARQIIDTKLIGDYKGFLRCRVVNGALYLDWIKRFNQDNPQPIKMAVNLLDRSVEENADEYYTIFLPVGANGRTIAAANNGSKYLKDDTGIRKYGRIYRAQNFSEEKGATGLKEEADKEFAKHGTNLPTSVRIKAVDMYLLGSNAQELKVGDHLTNVEDRTGQTFTDLTIVEMSYDIFNPANDEYVMENQEAVDKRSMGTSGNGTISSRTGGIDRGLDEDKRNLIKTYDNIRLTAQQDYQINANRIFEFSKYHNIVTDILDVVANEYNVRSSIDNITKVKIKSPKNQVYGYGDYIRYNDKTYMVVGPYNPQDHPEITNPLGAITYMLNNNLVVETEYGAEIPVKTIHGSHTRQDPDSQVQVIQDVSGIMLQKVANEQAPDFNVTTAYLEDDFVMWNGKCWRCVVPHKGAWVQEHFTEVLESDGTWHYEPVYRVDEDGYEVINVITGEKEYQLVDGNLDGVPVSNPIRSVTARTQTEFYDAIGVMDTYQTSAVVFSPDASYTVGQIVKVLQSDGTYKYYQCITNHSGGDFGSDHFAPLNHSTTTINGKEIYTLTTVTGSTLFHNESELDQIVGVVDVSQTRDPSTGKITSKNLVIREGAGLRAQTDQAEVGIFENGQLNAGLLVTSLNNNTSTIKAMQFKTSRQYRVGDLVQNGSKIYECTVAHKGEWNAAHFTERSGYIAKLSADVVDLGEFATVGQLDAVRITAEEIYSDTATHKDIYVGDVTAYNIACDDIDAGDITCAGITATSGVGGTEGYFNNLYLGDDDTAPNVADAVTSFGTPTYPTGQNYDVSIPFYTFNIPAGSQNPAGSINFSIANTAKYRADVGIASVDKQYTSNDYNDFSHWPKNNDTTLNTQYALLTVTPNSGSAYTYGLDMSGVYNSGWDNAAVSMGMGSASSETEYNSWTTGYTPVTVASGTGYRVYITKSDGRSIAGVKFLVPAQTAGGISSITVLGQQQAAWNQMTDYELVSSPSDTGYYTVRVVPNSGAEKKIKFTIPVQSGTITNMSIEESTSSATGDYDGGQVGINGYRLITATASGGSKTMKIREPSVSASFNTVSSLPSGKTATTLSSGTLRRFLVTVNNRNIHDVYYKVP